MRRRLLAAACTLFARQGYQATTLQQVVQEADTSVGNCYFYFSNKEALLLAVAEQFRREMAEEVEAAIASVPAGPSLLAAAVYRGVSAVLRQPALARAVFFETSLSSLRSLAVELFTGRIQGVIQKMPALFGEASRFGGTTSAALLAHAWYGPIQSVVEGVLTGRILDDPDVVARFVVRWNLQALGFSEEAVQEALQSLDTA